MTKRLIFTAAIFASFAVSSCKKDKEPSNTEKLEGAWIVEEYRVGTETIVPSSEPDFQVEVNFEFDSDGDFDLNYGGSYDGYSYSYAFPGRWSASDSELDLDFDEDSSAAMDLEASPSNYFAYNYYNYDENYQIIELTDTRLEMNTIINGRTVVIKANKF